MTRHASISGLASAETNDKGVVVHPGLRDSKPISLRWDGVVEWVITTAMLPIIVGGVVMRARLSSLCRMHSMTSCLQSIMLSVVDLPSRASSITTSWTGASSTRIRKSYGAGLRLITRRAPYSPPSRERSSGQAEPFRFRSCLTSVLDA